MSEIDRGKPEPMQTTVKPDGPTRVPPVAPLPHKDRIPEEEKISRRGFFKKAAAVGLAVGTLGTGTVAGINALEKAFSIGNPIPDLTTPVPGQPEPSKGPKPTPTKEPAIEIKPTGDLVWGYKDAPLWLLGKEYYIPEIGTWAADTSAIITDIYWKRTKVTGEPAKVWFIETKYKKGGEEITANFVLGRENDHIARTDLLGSVMIDDPVGPGSAIDTYFTPVKKIIDQKRGDSLKIGKQYALALYFDYKGPAYPEYIYPLFANNKKLVDFFRGRSNSLNPNQYYYAVQFYFPRATLPY